MKTLSILQPWASLIVQGHKRIETRSWNTKYRGPLLIHASAGFGMQQRLLMTHGHFFDVFSKVNPEIYAAETRNSKGYGLPLGAIIGMVNVEDTYTTEYILSTVEGAEGWLHFYHEEDVHTKIIRYPGEDIDAEMAFGDYSSGRFGWLLSKPVAFREPVPCKGSLGLWTPDAETMEAVQAKINLSKTT